MLDPLSPPFFFMFSSVLDFFCVYIYGIFSSYFSTYLPVLNRLDLSISDYNIALLVFISYVFFWFLGYKNLDKRLKIKNIILRLFTSGKPFAIEVLYLFFIKISLLFITLFLNHPGRFDVGRSSYTEGLYGKIFFLVITVLTAIYIVLTVHIFAFKFSTENSTKFTNKINTGKKLSSLLAVALILGNAFLLSFLYLQLEGRARALGPFISLIFIWHYLVKKIKAYILLIFAISLILLAIAIDVFIFQESYDFYQIFDTLFGVEHGRTFDSFYNLAMVVKYSSSQFNFTFGETFISDILSDLGISFGTTSRDYLMHDIYNFPYDITFGFPISKPGEFFLNFGWFGVAFGGYLLGYLSRYSYRVLIEGSLLSGVSVPIYMLLLNWLASPKGYFFQSIVLNFASIFFLFFFWIVLQGGGRIKIKQYYIRPHRD